METETKKMKKGTGIMKEKLFVLLGLVAAVIICTGSPALAISLGAAEGYNAFIFGDFSSTSDCQGRLAVGGNATLDGYAVGHELTEDTSGTTDTLVVGGNLTATNGVNVKNGNVKVGGTLNENYTLTVDNGTVSENTTAIDFGAAYTYLSNLSTQLASLTANGDSRYVVYDAGQLFLSGDGVSDLVIFDIDGLLFNSLNTFQISDVADGATVIINVSGSTISMPGFDMATFKTLIDNGCNILFNFYEAETLALTNIGFNGSILAVDAAITTTRGQFEGSVIAASYSGSGEFHNTLFESSATVPVPGSSLLLTFGLLGLAGWKRHFGRSGMKN